MDEASIQEFMGGMLGHLTGATTVAATLLADDLGLYAAASGAGPLSAAHLAERTGTVERLMRELLDQQASVGFFAYDPDADTYELVPEAALALADPDSPVYLAGGLQSFKGMMFDLDAAADAFRGERTLGWGEHSSCIYHGTREFFRPAYQHHLAQDWIPSMDGVADRLETGAVVLDVGCGEGFSTIRMAEAFPASTFVGVDFHQPSIHIAESEAADAGIDNVAFHVGDASEIDGDFDLICYFDCLHDMGDPVGIATTARNRLADGGSVMLVEPFALDTRQENHQALGGMMYGASALICTPCSLAQPVGRAMGAQAGEVGMRAVFDEAGYSAFRRVAETPFNIVYQATP